MAVAPTTIEEFLSLVSRSQLVSEPQLSAFVDALRARGQLPDDHTQLAAVMVRDGLLTDFQAEQLLLGKWRNFILANKYRILQRLGGSRRRTVLYLAEHVLMKRLLVVKVLPVGEAADPPRVERFHRHARSLAAIDHPNVVRVFEVGQEDRTHFLVMEYVDGSTLEHIVEQSGPLSVSRAAHYIRQAAIGLQALHESTATAHRRLRPNVLMVDRQGVIKLLEPERLAMQWENDSDSQEIVDYLCPEQALDSSVVDVRSDIYSLGCVFYFCLSGKPPFPQGTVAQKLIWHQTRQPRPLDTVRPEAPEGIVAIVERMLAKNPAERYQSAHEVVLALEPWTRTPIPPPPDSEMPPRRALREQPRPAESTEAELNVTTRLSPLLAAHLCSLGLCHVVHADLPAERPLRWLRGASCLGRSLPLALARDLGLLLAHPSRLLRIERPANLPADEDTSGYLAFLQRVAAFPLVRELTQWRPAPTDAVLGVLLARLVDGLQMPQRYHLPAGRAGDALLQEAERLLARLDPVRLWRETAPASRPDWKATLPQAALARIESNLRGLDRDEIQFLVRYGPGLASAPDPRDLADLLALTGLPPAVRAALAQSLRLLPRLTGTRQVGGIQTYPEGGYEGLARQGSLDSLLPTELAFSHDMLLHRLHNNEALYYGRERPRERRRELAYLVAQLGLGLGGDGQLLVRALLLALGQALRNRGYEVQYSIAGATLSEPRPLDRPGEVGRVLYHQEKNRVDASRVLQGVQRQLKQWRDYRVRQVLWIVSEHFDSDTFEEHEDLYRALRGEAGQQAWFVRVGRPMDGGPPPTARHYANWQIVPTDQMWQ